MKTYKNPISDLVEISIQENIENLGLEKSCYILQGPNLFKYTKNDIYSALTPIDQTKITKILSAYKIDGPTYKNNEYQIFEQKFDKIRLPKDLMQFAMKYFSTVFDKHGTECAVLLYFNDKKKDWKIVVPVQINCSKSSVNYLIPVKDIESINSNRRDYSSYEEVFKDKHMSKIMRQSYNDLNKVEQDDYRLYGTIHSHCDFSAFHSGVDDSDEMNFQGLHITIGNVDKNYSFSARLIIENECVVSFDNVSEYTNVENENDLKDNLDSIEIDKEYIDRINPSFGSVVKSYNQSNSFSTNESQSLWNSESSWYRGINWDSDKYDDSYWKSSSKDVDDEEGVMYERFAVRMYDKVKKVCLWVNCGRSWDLHKKYPGRFTELPDPPIPDHINSIDSKDNDGLEVQELYIVDPKSKSVKPGNKIDNLNEFIKSRRKAKKIDK